MIRSLLLVGLGGGLGSMARYVIQKLLPSHPFPWGTFAVNFTGSLAIGIIWGLATREFYGQDGKLFLMTGLLGGFTTFSAFSLESIRMIQENRITLFVIYVTASIFLCLLATFAGIKLAAALR